MRIETTYLSDWRPGLVQVWAVDLTCSEQTQMAGLSLLSPEERTRSDRLRIEVERRRFIIARSSLRVVLGACLGVQPEALVFETGSHGKPTLAVRPALHFNISHSSDLALMALCRDHAVGVDVEQQARSHDDLDDIARNFFSASERVAYFDLPPVRRVAAFYRVWTRKEAVAKALGLGMALPGPSFDVTVDETRPRLLRLDGPAEDWLLMDINPAVGFFGAVAVQARELSIVMRRLDPLVMEA